MSNNKYAIYNISIGGIRVDYSDSEVVAIRFCFADSVSCYGVRTPFSNCVVEQLQEFFEGRRKQFTFAWRVEGTPFQQKVWRELCAIPYGECRTYKEIAEAIGSPRASRAVGMACNRNPMMIVVPCHRVVGSTGRLVGYAGGVDLKRKLLDLECGEVNDLFRQ